MAEEGRVDLAILGGGQLARMLLHAASALGLDVAVMEREPDSPAGRLTRHEIVGSWDDEDALRRLAALAPRITLENEFVPARSLYRIEQLGVAVVPGSAALATVQDKLSQKSRLDAAGLPVPPFDPWKALATCWLPGMSLAGRCCSSDAATVTTATAIARCTAPATWRPPSPRCKAQRTARRTSAP